MPRCLSREIQSGDRHLGRSFVVFIGPVWRQVCAEPCPLNTRKQSGSRCLPMPCHTAAKAVAPSRLPVRGGFFSPVEGRTDVGGLGVDLKRVPKILRCPL